MWGSLKDLCAPLGKLRNLKSSSPHAGWKSQGRREPDARAFNHPVGTGEEASGDEEGTGMGKSKPENRRVGARRRGKGSGDSTQQAK